MAMRRAGKLGFVSKHPIICQSEKPGESLDIIGILVVYSCLFSDETCYFENWRVG